MTRRDVKKVKLTKTKKARGGHPGGGGHARQRRTKTQQEQQYMDVQRKATDGNHRGHMPPRKHTMSLRTGTNKILGASHHIARHLRTEKKTKQRGASQSPVNREQYSNTGLPLRERIYPKPGPTIGWRGGSVIRPHRSQACPVRLRCDHTHVSSEMNCAKRHWNQKTHTHFSFSFANDTIIFQYILHLGGGTLKPFDRDTKTTHTCFCQLRDIPQARRGKGYVPLAFIVWTSAEVARQRHPQAVVNKTALAT